MTSWKIQERLSGVKSPTSRTSRKRQQSVFYYDLEFGAIKLLLDLEIL